MINRERVLNEFFELVQINCSTKGERQIADLLTQKLTDIGLQVQEDNVGEKIGGSSGNIIGYLKGNRPGAPVVMFGAHMDSVEPCSGIRPKLENGIITSAGDTVLGSDDKSGIVPILEALRCIKEQDLPHGDIQIVFTAAEEGGVNGSKNMNPALLKADFGYALDSSGNPGDIIVMAPGQNKVTVTVHGKKAHAGIAPEEGLNAIVLAGKALAELEQGRIDEETTANVGVISGGSATNVVPDKVELRCETRSRNASKLEKLTQEFADTFTRVVAANGGKADVVVGKAYGPYVLNEDDLVVDVAKKAAVSIGCNPVTRGTGGGSDANFFNNYGVPCAVLATGMTKVHTTEEYIKEEDLYKTAEWVLAIVQQAANMKK